MDVGTLIGRGMSFPPHVGADGRIAWSEGSNNVREAIQVILLTEQRERLMLPDFGGGLSALLFEPNTTTTRHRIQDRIERSLAEWEPRIVVESVTVEEDPGDPRTAVATITYRLVATQSRERVTFNISLAA